MAPHRSLPLAAVAAAVLSAPPSALAHAPPRPGQGRRGPLPLPLPLPPAFLGGGSLRRASSPSPSPLPPSPSLSSPAPPAPLGMCICIDCARVRSCQGYYFVEDRHGQPHMDPSPSYDPRDGSPTIKVTYRTITTADAESEYERMVREHSAEERRAAAAGGRPADGAAAPSSPPPELHGEETYDLSPVTSMEYDVVACEDYVEERGAWVRNMPEEIRKANPDFVPT